MLTLQSPSFAYVFNNTNGVLVTNKLSARYTDTSVKEVGGKHFTFVNMRQVLGVVKFI